MASFYYSGTPPYSHLVITATLFWQPAKTGKYFVVKKKNLVHTAAPLIQPIFFRPSVEAVLTSFHCTTTRMLQFVVFCCAT